MSPFPRLTKVVVMAAAIVLALTGAVGCGPPPKRPLRTSLAAARPMSYQDETGKPRGFLVDALNAAAERAGLALDWRVTGDMQANNEALRRGELDILAGVDTPGRRREFFVSDPWWSSELTILFRAGTPVRRESDINGRRLAVPRGAGPALPMLFHPGQVIPVDSAVAVAAAVCSGTADAGIIATIYMRELLLSPAPSCTGVHLDTLDASARVDYVLVAQPSMAGAVQSLKRGLDSITADGTLASIAAQHPPISTPQATRMAELMRIGYERRIWTIAFAAGTILLLIAVVFLVKQGRARRRLRAVNAQLHEDLLARERAEAALRDSEARFRALLDSAPGAVVAIDRAGKIVFANRTSQEMFGYPDLIATDVARLVPEQFSDVFRHPDGSPRNGKPGSSDVIALRADGTEFPVEIRLGAIETGGGLTLAFITDISDRVALQRQFLQAQKLESVGQLAGGVAHDFNNLLTVITGYAQIMLDALPPEDHLREPLEEVALAAERAAALTRQLLAFSRRQKAVARLVSLNDLLRNLEKMLRRLIGEDIELVLTGGDIGVVLADPGQIEQVVVNLAINARDAMPNGGRLEIETAPFRVEPAYESGHPGLSPGDYAVLRVSDTGHGMTPDIQARIFEPFFTTKGPGKGTGLGLSTVYGIVKQSGGEIMIYSEPGRGTTFKILLPIAEGQAEPEAEDRHPFGSHGQETILLAEDEPGVRKFVHDVLEAHGYTVLEAANGDEALEIAARYQGPIHLLLSDLVMPKLGGAELAERIRETRPALEILHMSGYSDRILGPEAAEVIEKPFTPGALLLRVREVLDARRRAGGAA